MKSVRSFEPESFEEYHLLEVDLCLGVNMIWFTRHGETGRQDFLLRNDRVILTSGFFR